MNPTIAPRGVSRPKPNGSTGALAAGAVGAGLVVPGRSEETCGIANAPVAMHSATARNAHRYFLAANLWMELTKNFPV